eukprot:12398200-Heterocapsa_arctica.AAC.1
MEPLKLPARRHGCALEYASEDLKGDVEVVYTYVPSPQRSEGAAHEVFPYLAAAFQWDGNCVPSLPSSGRSEGALHKVIPSQTATFNGMEIVSLHFPVRGTVKEHCTK